jgi:hypothetical protein
MELNFELSSIRSDIWLLLFGIKSTQSKCKNEKNI